MSRDHERRISALEARARGNAEQTVIWVNEGDGLFRHGDEVLSREEYQKRFPNSIHFTIKLGKVTEADLLDEDLSVEAPAVSVEAPAVSVEAPAAHGPADDRRPRLVASNDIVRKPRPLRI